MPYQITIVKSDRDTNEDKFYIVSTSTLDNNLNEIKRNLDSILRFIISRTPMYQIKFCLTSNNTSRINMLKEDLRNFNKSATIKGNTNYNIIMWYLNFLLKTEYSDVEFEKIVDSSIRF